MRKTIQAQIIAMTTTQIIPNNFLKFTLTYAVRENSIVFQRLQWL